MIVLKKDGKLYKERMKELLSNKWLDKKHVKHSRIVVAHFESEVANSKTGYTCNVCGRPSSCYKVQNKRKTSKFRKKDWDVSHTRFCWECRDEILEKFPAKLDYCR